METLMHTCCAPCSVSCIRQLREEGIEPVSFWYNPNIHPYQEYKARRDTLMAIAPAIGMKLIVREDYGLRDFCRAVCGDIDTGAAAAITSACGRPPATRRSTGTAASPAPVRQPLPEPRAAAADGGGGGRSLWRGVLYRDFRPGFRAGQQEARERGFYMQKYCGCVFSEEDRYRKQIDRDLKQPEKIIQG